MAYKDKNDPRAKESRRKWYLNNKERQLKRQAERSKFHRRLLRRYKSFLKCHDCGLSFRNKPYLCDFHHIDSSNKEVLVSRMSTYSKKAIKKEISKCVPLCANCHRERHANDLYV